MKRLVTLLLAVVLVYTLAGYAKQERQYRIYEDFVVKCLNGNWIVNGDEAVVCVRL